MGAGTSDLWCKTIWRILTLIYRLRFLFPSLPASIYTSYNHVSCTYSGQCWSVAQKSQDHPRVQDPVKQLLLGRPHKVKQNWKELLFWKDLDFVPFPELEIEDFDFSIPQIHGETVSVVPASSHQDRNKSRGVNSQVRMIRWSWLGNLAAFDDLCSSNRLSMLPFDG